ncbi:smad nuclear-interacting protein 1 isoform X2 [Rhynchophorus ferrugineus]
MLPRHEHKSKRSRSRSRSYDTSSRHRDKSRSRDHKRELERDKHGGKRSSRDRGGDKESRRNYSHGDVYHSRDRYGKRGDFHNQNHRVKSYRDRRERRHRSRSNSFDHVNAKWGKNNKDEIKDVKNEPQEKQKPNFALSGKLTEETNTYRGVVIKYSEPPEARKPKRRWRLYPFKGEKALQTLYIHRESGYLIGRDRKVVDLPVDHPSCSKQHAALQYRLVPFTREDGSSGKRVRPYIIDLDSANGTYINNNKIEPRKYVELLERDVIKFGFSSREYVLLHENSKDEALDDDVKGDEEEVKEELEVKEEAH